MKGVKELYFLSLLVMSLCISNHVSATVLNQSDESTPDEVSTYIAQGLLINDDDGALVVFAVKRDTVPVPGATVTVDGKLLKFGLSTENNAEGTPVGMVLPYYYAELEKYVPGQMVDIVVKDPDGNIIFETPEMIPALIPGNMKITKPEDADWIDDNKDYTMKWDDLPAKQEYPYTDMYIAGYKHIGKHQFSDTELDEPAKEGEEQKYAYEYVEVLIGHFPRELVIPHKYLVRGPGLFYVMGVSGDPNALALLYDIPGLITDGNILKRFEYFPTGTRPDANQNAFAAISVDLMATHVGPDWYGFDTCVPLIIVKRYKERFKERIFKFMKKFSFKVTVRENDPMQIEQPGVVGLKIKMRSWKPSFAMIMVFDMDGNKIYEDDEERFFSFSSKNWRPHFKVPVGATVAIGTYNASFRWANYYYDPVILDEGDAGSR